MNAGQLEERWSAQAAWARTEAARLHPSSPLHAATNETELRTAMERLRDARAQAFLELSTGTKQPVLAKAAGWIAGNLELELVPVVARAIWITQGCPGRPPDQERANH
jgi:hypothetical protein